MTGCSIDVVDFYIDEKQSDTAFAKEERSLEVIRSDLCKEGVGLELVNIEHDPLPYPANSLDFVLCEHTIEHLRNPKMLLTESHRVLRPGGMMWCTTPNAAYLPKRLVLLRGKSPLWPIDDFYERGLDFHGHIREYTSSDLAIVFRKAGFSRIDLKWYSATRGVWSLLGRLHSEFHQAVGVVAFK